MFHNTVILKSEIQSAKINSFIVKSENILNNQFKIFLRCLDIQKAIVMNTFLTNTTSHFVLKSRPPNLVKVFLKS